MKNFTNLSIKKKLGIISGAGIFVTAMIVIGYGSYQSRNYAIKNAREFLVLEAQNQSQEIQGILEDAMNDSRTVSKALSIVGNPNYRGEISRETAQQMATQVLNSNKEFIGFTLAFEANAFDALDSKYANSQAHDETGRFLSYVTKTADGGVSIDVLIDYQTADKAPWYFKPFEEKTDFLTEPVIYPIQGKDVLMVSCMTPIVFNNQSIGVTGIDYPIDFMQKLVMEKRSKNEDYHIAIISNSGIYAANTEKPELLNKSISEENNTNLQQSLADIQQAKLTINQTDGNVIVSVPLQVGFTKHPWQLRAKVPLATITREANAIMWQQILMGIVFSILGVSLVVWYVVHAVRPLEGMVKLANDMADGLLNTKVQIKTANDEIGNLYGAFMRMRHKLVEIIQQIKDGAEQINSASLQLSNTSIQVSQGASEQASSTEEVSSTMQQMTSNIHQNSDNSVRAMTIANKMTTDILTGAQSADSSVQQMNEVVAKISFIKGVAAQTNILSLNAAVEAARSGEHGKGFAVVASEVRKLADHTSNASVVIDNLTKTSQQTINETGELMQRIVPQINETTRLLEEISSSSREQTTGAEQVNSAIQQLNSITQQNAAASEELASSSEELASQAENLKHLTEYFKI